MKKVHIEKGTKFGRWTVVDEAPSKKTAGGEQKRHMHCVCECGNEKAVPLAALRSEKSKSCGCHNLDVHTKHGMSRTSIYVTWASMIYRCTNKNSTHYSSYGGRGITVCERWKSFENFYADVGDAPEGRTLDRIDNDKGYEPSNIRWATRKEQQRNTRATTKTVINGETKPSSEWSELLGISIHAIRHKYPRTKLYTRREA